MVRRETGVGSLSYTICGPRGHTAGRCWVGSSGNRGSRQGTLTSLQMSRHHSHPEPSVAHMFVSVTFPEFSPCSQHKVLVYSGMAGNFINKVLAHSLGNPIVPVDVPFPVHTLDSRPLGLVFIREATVPLNMVTQGGHRGHTCFYVLILLRIPWCWAYPG
jgi:hypothetical protein